MQCLGTWLCLMRRTASGNVYKPQNVTANKLKNALKGRKKLLLTATPLQNNLMELYGLVSFIDEHVFGDAKTFREMYVAVNNAELRNRNLRDRLSVFCKRTLRKQVTEYVRYTERHAILQEYTPTKDEELLYNSISSYLQTDHLYALPAGQRTLITMVLRKLLASSSFAIAGTLNSLIDRCRDCWMVFSGSWILMIMTPLQNCTMMKMYLRFYRDG